MNPSRNRRISSSPALDPGMSRQVQGGLTVAALVLVPLLAVATGDAFRAALDFAAGVLSLVSLTAAVAWGLIATDRLLLSSRHRLLAQGIHRATAVASLGFLLLHVTVKVSLGHVSLIGAVVPFGLGLTGTNGLIGFGSLAGLLMIVAATTGAMRSAFATPGRIAGRWRAMHMVAYPAWCFALVHGLYTGRLAATWVTTMYCISLVGVAAAVSLRLLPRHLQNEIADRLIAMTGGQRRTREPEQSLRDLSADPLPGATGLAPQPQYEQLRREPSLSGQPLGAPLGRPRTPPRLSPPSPPLYEAERAPMGLYAGGAGGSGGDSPSDAFADPFSGRTPDPVSGPGTGLSAGYRAVSLGTDPTTVLPVTPPYGAAPGSPSGTPSGDVPLAERIPMTEELPIITEESTGRPGSWPAPSPPPPGQAFTPPAPTPAPAAPSPYDTGSVPTYDTGATPPYDTGSVPTYDAGATPAYDTGSAPQYDTGSVPVYGPNAASPYDTGAIPAYDTGALPAYDTGNLPPYTGQAPASPVGPSYEGSAYDGTGPRPGSEPPPGPLYQPPAGEPWNAPAGDRP
ncbi:ferric reductase-like transmembrane domain-containing protein [Streptomyces liangshanensis]|nr:ferric reductase-like transmembrane domain-containing protein [Streptomyces liangshanensis]